MVDASHQTAKPSCRKTAASFAAVIPSSVAQLMKMSLIAVSSDRFERIARRGYARVETLSRDTLRGLRCFEFSAAIRDNAPLLARPKKRVCADSRGASSRATVGEVKRARVPHGRPPPPGAFSLATFQT